MANSVDLVIGSEAIKQVENLISKLSLADAELLKISQSATTASKGITGISTPSGLDKAVSNTSALNAELERQNKIIQALEIEIKKLSYARQNNNKQTASEAVNQRILNQNAINEAKSTSNLVGAYQKLDLEHKKAITNAQNLGVKYGETSTQFLKAAEKANLLDVKLKAIDSSLGKNQRNVGNYASGFNALGNSINQLSREAPAFANSINTGFMALSNNFPALFDAINGIRTQNKALAAEGKPTVSVLKSLAGAVFGWQTLLSIGVTLLTLYGGKLAELVLGIGNTELALKKLEIQQNKYNKALENANETIDHNLILERNRLKQLGESDEKISELEIKAAKNKLRNFEISRDLSKKELDNEAKKILSKKGIVINGFSDEIGLYESLTAKKIALEKSLGKEIVKFTYLARTDKEKAEVESLAKTNLKLAALETLSNNEIYQSKKKFYIESENAAKESGLKLSELVSNNKTKIIEDDRKEEAKKKSKQAKAKREDLYYLQSYVKPVGTIVDEINKEIDRLTTEKIIANETELPAINEQLRLLLELKKQLNAVPTGGALPEGFATPQIPTEQMNKLKSDWKDTFNEIADSAQKAGEIIAGFSEMNFKNEYARLEAQKDISLKFAGDSTAAKQKIEEDYEKKRKEIANRENKAKQRQALFNIAIDTAQAVVEALPNIPLAIAMGVFGAAQAVLVASQKVPEYFAGTDNHQGGLMLVNDGGGSNYQEKVILPNGKEVMPEGRNVLMNAPKGTKVLTHEQQIREMLNERGISMSANYSKNNGMTAEEMDMVMSKHFSRIQVNNTSFDKNGFSSWSERNGNRTKQNANRVSRTGFKV